MPTGFQELDADGDAWGVTKAVARTLGGEGAAGDVSEQIFLSCDGKADLGEGAAGRFADHAKMRVGRLIDVIARRNGALTDLVLSISVAIDEKQMAVEDTIDVSVNGVLVDRIVLHKWYRQHQAFIPLSSLFRDENEIVVQSRRSKGFADAKLPHAIEALFMNRAAVRDEMERRSIWVFSTARSGSTWLVQDILGWGHRVRPMDETGLGRMFAPLEWDAERFFKIEARNRAFASGFAYETGEIEQPGHDQALFVRHFAETARGELVEKVGSRFHRDLFLSSLRTLALEHAMRVWGIFDFQRLAFKCPNEAHAADIIMKAFPAAFMIFLVRDGRDVLRSRFTPFQSVTLARTSDKALRLHAVSFYSHFWNFQIDIMRSAFDNHDPDRRLFLQYEDIRRDPATHIRDMLDRLKLPLPEDALAKLIEDVTLENIPAEQRGADKPRQSGKIGGFRGSFSDEEIELMESIMGDNLRRYGYI